MTPTRIVLLLDAGNSALKLACVATGAVNTLGQVFTVPYESEGAEPAATPLAARVDAAVAHACGANVPAGVIGCSVTDSSRMGAIAAVVQARTGVPPQWLGSQPHFNAGGLTLDNGYRDPLQLGADRWHAMLGARASRLDQDFVLVQAGTATTVDAVSAAGRFLGGTILPGWSMMLASLSRGTARLPRAQGAPMAFPDHTDAAIATGVRDAQVGAVLQFATRYGAQLSGAAPLPLLLTGGGATPLAAGLATAQAVRDGHWTLEVQDNLVLRGLAWRAPALS